MHCWGGQLANANDAGMSAVPTPVPGLTSGVTAISVSISGNLACAILGGGAVECVGENGLGQLGNGSTISSSTPVQVTGLASGVTAVSVGGSTVCAITAEGAVKCWGDNSQGMLGNGTTFAIADADGGGWGMSAVPVQVTGLTSGVTSVSVGLSSACALTAAGGVQCWGRDFTAVGVSSAVPVQVAGLTSGVTAISTGADNPCVIVAGGGVQCWGEWDLGYPLPTAVTGLPTGVTSVSAGWSFACAVLSSGRVECLGTNGFGQLGDNSMMDSKSPVEVTGL
jgi:alpha-tubulin suppressor-like RCC1 family protein